MAVQVISEDDNQFTWGDPNTGATGSTAKTPEVYDQYLRMGGSQWNPYVSQSVTNPVQPQSSVAPSVEVPQQPQPEFRGPPQPQQQNFVQPIQQNGASGSFDSPAPEVSQDVPFVTDPRSQQAGQQGMPLTVPITESTTSFSGHINDPKAMAELEAQTRQAQQNAKDQAAGFDAIDTEMAKKSGELEQATQEKAQLQKERGELEQKVNQDYLTNLDSMIQEFNQMKVQPKEIMESGNIGQNILAAISIGLGSISQGMTGEKQNPALAIIDKAIERDLEAQKANIQKKSMDINMLGLRYQAALKAGLAPKDAEIMAKSTTMESISNYLKGLAQRTPNQVAKANMLMQADQIGIQSAQYKVQATQQSIQTVTHKKDQVLDPKKMGLTGKISDSKISELDANVAIDNQIQEIRDFYDTVYSDKSTPAIEARLNKYARILGLDDTDKTVLKANLQANLATFIRAQSGKAASDKERAFLASIMPSDTDNPQTFKALLDVQDKANARAYYTGLHTGGGLGNIENYKAIELRSPFAKEVYNEIERGPASKVGFREAASVGH